MEFPFTLIVLLVLPFLVAAVIVAVSSARRRQAEAHGSAAETRHRGQADTAAVQDAAVPPPAGAPTLRAGRDRRADAARGSTDA